VIFDRKLLIVFDVFEIFGLMYFIFLCCLYCDTFLVTNGSHGVLLLLILVSRQMATSNMRF